jgi:hypothetical protein
METKKYTEQEVYRMTLSQMRSIKTLSELPDSMAERIRAKLSADAGLVINTATLIHLVSPNGRKVFHAQRHSDRRSGASVWSVSYCKKVWGVQKDVIGYSFDTFEVRFGRTADGTFIPKTLPYKKDVLELLKHIDWCKGI